MQSDSICYTFQGLHAIQAVVSHRRVMSVLAKDCTKSMEHDMVECRIKPVSGFCIQPLPSMMKLVMNNTDMPAKSLVAIGSIKHDMSRLR